MPQRPADAPWIVERFESGDRADLLALRNVFSLVDIPESWYLTKGDSDMDFLLDFPAASAAR